MRTTGEVNKKTQKRSKKRTPKKPMALNVVVVSDLHCGCRLGLCPPDGVSLDDGMPCRPSALQVKLWAFWDHFWNEWVPAATRGEPFVLVVNGDATDGVPHGKKAQISTNLADQGAIARACLEPVVKKAQAYYHIRGTEAHAGKSGEEEERLAFELGAVPNKLGQHARYDLWLNVGGFLVHFLHHVGTTGSAAYEATAVHKELVEEFIEAARWGKEAPSVVVRSHRHRQIEIRIPWKGGEAIAFTTPSWQLKPSYAYKIAGARISEPQNGGSLIRVSEEGIIYSRHYVETIGRTEAEDA